MLPVSVGVFVAMDDEGFDLKPWVSVISGVVGVCLVAGSFFVASTNDAHKLFNDITQLIMLIAGAVAIIVAIVSFFLRDTPDIWM